MTNRSLAESYLQKARIRLDVLPILHEGAAYSDVVRESQEIVELALKGILRFLGIEPPHWHDVGGLLLEYRARLPAAVSDEADRLAEISAWLRKEREFSFYGEIDFIPTERYGQDDGERAMEGARRAVDAAERVIDPDQGG